MPAGAAFRGEEHNTIGRARQAASCHLAMTRTEARVDANGGPVTLKLAARTGKDCAKAAMADEAWIDVANLGDRAITFQIQPNTTGLPREGHVRVVSPDVGDAVTVKITQRPDAGDEK